MSAATRPVHIPPPAPSVDVPTTPGALELLPPPPDDHLRWWGSVAITLILLAQVPPGAWALAGAPWPGVWWIGWEAATVGGVLLLRLGWLIVLARDDRRRLTWERQAAHDAWRMRVQAQAGAFATQQALARQHGASLYGAMPVSVAPTEPGPVIQHTPQQEAAQVAFRAAIVADTVAAVVEQLTPLLTDTRARVAPAPAPVPDEGEPTAHLDPARDLLDAAYRNGPTWKLVERAATGASIANNQVCPWLVTNRQWRRAVAALGGAGVLVSEGPRQPWLLAADLPTADVTELHKRVVDRLWEADCVPADLPSDLDL